MKLEVNREYKDALFSALFNNPEGALELYNALNGSSYTDPSMIEIVTLEEGIYLGMLNDVSFILSYDLNLFEHQSTENPNMPLRGFFYFAAQYQKLLEHNYDDIYGRRKVSLYTPRFIVFCNDPNITEDHKELKLSDLFSRGGGDLECIAHVLNINSGHNRELMEKSERLLGYAELNARVRNNYKHSKDLSSSIQLAVESCIKDGILVDFLKANKMGVIGMILEEYTLEKQLERVQHNSYEDGHAEGHAEGLAEGVSKGQLLLLGCIQRLKDGESESSILASGVPEDTLALAKEAIK